MGEPIKTDTARHVFCLVAVLAASALMYGPLADLFRSNLKMDHHTLIPAIPIISLYLFYLIRKDIRGEARFCLPAGVPVIFVGIALYAAVRYFGAGLNRNDFATVTTFSAWVVLVGGFISAYGLQVFRLALFPLLFLVFMVPFPVCVMDAIITFLQVGSTEFTNLLFMASGVSYVREGFVFHLPSISVEVAKQCSGIRSGLALFITALLAGHLFLRTGWKKLLLALAVIPITMFKNGIRITSLTLLGEYVNPRILQSDLHREGGIPFFILALLLVAPILYYLKKSEGKGKNPFPQTKFGK